LEVSTPLLPDADASKNPARDQTCPGWQGRFMEGWMDGWMENFIYPRLFYQTNKQLFFLKAVH